MCIYIYCINITYDIKYKEFDVYTTIIRIKYKRTNK